MSEMMRSAIIRVRRESDNQVVGMGFLIDEERKVFLTCAHVINSALGIPNNEEKPRTHIGIDFPFVDGKPGFDARVIHFHPVRGKKIDDIAMLEVLDDLPQGVKAAQLATADSYSGHEFGVYGFPVGFEASAQYVEGKLQEKLVNERIQAVGTSNLGYFVERGFSGSPVYDKDLDAVIGMMMQVDARLEKRVAFVSPVDIISTLYYGLDYKKFGQVQQADSTSDLPSPSGKWLQRVDIFISSPGDVAEEREAILRVIERLNRLQYIRDRYVLNPLLYEKEVPPQAGDHAQMIVDRYINVVDSYLLICLMWNRMGTPFTHPKTGEEFQSGTEYEFTVGYRANEKSGKPHLLLYRKDTDASDTDGKQKEKVDQFFKQFEEDKATFKGLYKKFSSMAEFEAILFEHIERVLHYNPPETDRMDTRIDRDTYPDIVEESRRLDAAMPRKCQIGKPTEVRVMVCLPDSQGLSDLLPDYTAKGERIDKRDVRQGSLAVKFPINSDTGQPESILATVEIESTDFDIPKPEQHIELSPEVDSGQLVFHLIARQSGGFSRVHVRVTTTGENGIPVVLGSASLHTQVVTQIRQLGATLWSIVITPLMVLASSYKQEENISDRDSLKEETASHADDRSSVQESRWRHRSSRSTWSAYIPQPPPPVPPQRDRSSRSTSSAYIPPSRKQKLKHLAKQLGMEEINLPEDILENKVLAKFDSQIAKSNIIDSDSLDTIRQDADELAELASRISQLLENNEQAGQLAEQAQHQAHLAHEIVARLESSEKQISRLRNDPDSNRIKYAQELYQQYQSDLRTLGIEPDEFAAARHIEEEIRAFIDAEHKILDVMNELQRALNIEEFNMASELINHLENLPMFHPGIQTFYWQDSYTEDSIKGVNQLKLVLKDKIKQIAEMQNWAETLPDRARIYRVQSEWQVIMNEAEIAISSGKFQQTEEKVIAFQQEIEKHREKFRSFPLNRELKSHKAEELDERYREKRSNYEQLIHEIEDFLSQVKHRQRKFERLLEELEAIIGELQDKQKKTTNLWRFWLLWGLRDREKRIQNLRTQAEKIITELKRICPNDPNLSNYKATISKEKN